MSVCEICNRRTTIYVIIEDHLRNIVLIIMPKRDRRQKEEVVSKQDALLRVTVHNLLKILF